MISFLVMPPPEAEPRRYIVCAADIQLTAYARMLIRRVYGPGPRGNRGDVPIDLRAELTPDPDPIRANCNQNLQHPDHSL